MLRDASIRLVRVVSENVLSEAGIGWHSMVLVIVSRRRIGYEGSGIVEYALQLHDDDSVRRLKDVALTRPPYRL